MTAGGGRVIGDLVIFEPNRDGSNRIGATETSTS